MIAAFHKLKRAGFGLVAALLATGTAVPLLLNVGQANAAQVTTRSIEMSNSLPSASGSTYTVTFTPGQTTTIGGIIVDFCDDSPLVGSTTCTYPAGFTLGSATPSVTSQTGMGTGWTASALQSSATSGNYDTLELTNTTAQSLSTSTPVSFVINGVTNPSTANHEFYARIITVDTSADTSNYTLTAGSTTRVASFTGEKDYGGDAMSTTETIAITAAVQEQLSFCVSGTLLSGAQTCSNATAASLTLGTGTPAVLTTSATPSTAAAATQISTNAGGGVSVRMLNSNSCGGLERAGDGATCYIAPAGATAYTFVANAAKFGLNVGASTVGTGGSGATTAVSAYGTSGQYAMDATTSGNNVTAAPGSQIMTVNGSGANLVNTPLTFAANDSNTTPAGIYTANMTLIATGTF